MVHCATNCSYALETSNRVTVADNKVALLSEDSDTDLEAHGDKESGNIYWRRFCTFWRTAGPGIMVCLADSDGPGLITAAQSGAEFKYSLIFGELLLIPVLFAAQEITVRLAIFTRRGMTELIRDCWGSAWGWTMCSFIVLICISAIISEIDCISQVGYLWGIPLPISCILTISFLGLIVVFGGYQSVEVIGTMLGCAQLVFIPICFMAKPNWSDVVYSLFNYDDVIHPANLRYGLAEWKTLLTANIGAVIMPWMLFYQQSAVCEKKLRPKHLGHERLDTAIGATLTQVVMCAMIICFGAIVGATKPQTIEKVEDIVTTLTPSVGSPIVAKAIISCGMLGASLVAALVVSLTAAWSVAEAVGMPRSLDLGIREAPLFYGGYFCVLLLGMAVTLAVGIEEAVKFNICVQELNAFLIPIVMGLLYFLAVNENVLPEAMRLKGWYKWTIASVFTTCSVCSIYVGVTGNLT